MIHTHTNTHTHTHTHTHSHTHTEIHLIPAQCNRERWTEGEWLFLRATEDNKRAIKVFKSLLLITGVCWGRASINLSTEFVFLVYVKARDCVCTVSFPWRGTELWVVFFWYSLPKLTYFFFSIISVVVPSDLSQYFKGKVETVQTTDWPDRTVTYATCSNQSLYLVCTPT